MNTQCFLLVDGLLKPDAVAQLYRRQEGLEIESIYTLTRFARLGDVGPFLAQTSPALCEQWRSDPVWQACSYLLWSPAPRKKVAAHLRRFVSPANHLGGIGLLRFADPLVAWYWLASYSPDHLPRTLGPIERVELAVPRQPWQTREALRFTTFKAGHPAPVWEDDFALLGAVQLEALKNASFFRFKQRLHASLTGEAPALFAGHSSEQIDAWLEQSLCSGHEWGLNDEYSLATWAWYRHVLGEHFITAPQGAWQTWLARHPEQQQRTPEQRLEAFDRDHDLTLPLTCENAHD